MKEKLGAKLQDWRQRFWEWQPSSPWAAAGVSLVRVLGLAWKDLWDQRALLRASSLAYTSIMAIIPLLALLFAIFKGLGLQRLLATHLVPQLTAGSQEFARQILDYIEGTKVASLGIFGVIWLLVALMILMSNVEEAFNSIWRVNRARVWWRKLADYLSIFLLFPIFMAVAATIATTFQRQPAIQAMIRDFLPPFFFTLYNLFFSFGMTWLGFTFIYLVIPYTRVHFASALLGGLVASLIWHTAQWIFHLFQASAPYYNAVYGALYQLLFLIIWIFWSWLIVLYGGEVVYAHQHRDRLQQQGARSGAPVLGFEFLALGALLYIWRHYQGGRGAVAASELADFLRQQDGLAQEVCRALTASGFILPVGQAGESPQFLPSRPLSQVTVHEVLQRLQQYRWTQVARSLPADDQITAVIARLAQEPAGAAQHQVLAAILNGSS